MAKKASKKRRRKTPTKNEKPAPTRVARLGNDIGLLYPKLIRRHRDSTTKLSERTDQMDFFTSMGGVEHESSNVSSEIEQLGQDIQGLRISLLRIGDQLKDELDEVGNGDGADIITRLELSLWSDTSLDSDLFVQLDRRRRRKLDTERDAEKQETAKGAAPANQPDPSAAVHSADFSSANWFGTHYQFTKTQALCIKLLWSEWDKGSLGLSEKTIGDDIGSDNDNYRLAHTFRTKSGSQHPAWGTMIRPAGKGIFRLCAPNHQ